MKFVTIGVLALLLSGCAAHTYVTQAEPSDLLNASLAGAELRSELRTGRCYLVVAFKDGKVRRDEWPSSVCANARAIAKTLATVPPPKTGTAEPAKAEAAK